MDRELTDEEIGCAYLKYVEQPEGRAISRAQIQKDNDWIKSHTLMWISTREYYLITESEVK